jgi:hypothetical protein
MKLHPIVAALLVAVGVGVLGLDSVAGRLVSGATASTPAEDDLRHEAGRLEREIASADGAGDAERAERLCRELIDVVVEWRQVVKASAPPESWAATETQPQ